jgi:hypothetical protein
MTLKRAILEGRYLFLEKTVREWYGRSHGRVNRFDIAFYRRCVVQKYFLWRALRDDGENRQ